MIERVRLRHFRRYREATLHFQEGVNFIEGYNNVGKTSLFYAIEYALFGRVENFKSIRALVQPGKRSMGVELVLIGRGGERLLLQRVHQLPPRSRKTMEGHFTLKLLAEEGERYLLASDFGDTEDKLALKLQELTGLTRRLFSVALHMRQGEIAAILDGARQLDIVLGVTAASMAEEEVRAMALELEKASAGLPVLQERLRALGKDLEEAAGEVARLEAERNTTAEKLASLGESADPRKQLEGQLAPLLESIATWEEGHGKVELARQRLQDEQERWQDLSRGGSQEILEREMASFQDVATERQKTVNKLRGELEDMEDQRRKLDQQRGDLSGRIDRRRQLPTGKGATCEACGAPIDAAHMAKELAQWTAELGKLDGELADLQERQTALQAALEKESQEERAQLERAAQIQDRVRLLREAAASLARRQQEHDDAGIAEEQVFASVRKEVEALATQLQETSLSQALREGEPPAVINAIRKAIQALQQALAEKAGRQIAERQALTDLLERLDEQIGSAGGRQMEREREQATARAEAATQEKKAARAARYRRLVTGFKDLQAQIRAEAATRLAADTLALHRQLSERDEFTSLSIDPAQYAVQVVPRDLGEEVPAGLYEGGGHRLLLGLAFRLAVARLVEHCPFLMLDEPTYGLDASHREALLNRIAGQDVSRQILLVTHQAMGDIVGHRIQVARKDRETVVVGTPEPSAS